MQEPAGLIERLRDGCPTAHDLAFVDYKIGGTSDRTELKLLQQLRVRIIALSASRNMP